MVAYRAAHRKRGMAEMLGEAAYPRVKAVDKRQPGHVPLGGGDSLLRLLK